MASPDLKFPVCGSEKLDFNKYIEDLDQSYQLISKDALPKNNPDGNPDTYVLFKKISKDEKELLLQLFDLDDDKSIDLVKHFRKGKMIKVESLNDAKGETYVVTEYDPETGKETKQQLKDGRICVSKYFYKGELRRIERDRNGDGKPDFWEYFRDGKTLKTEVDENFDGNRRSFTGKIN